MNYYCSIVNALGNMLDAIGTGAHTAYVKAGEILYYISTFGGCSPQ